MTRNYRRERAHETETIIARYLTESGWPWCEPVGAGRQGADLTGTPGLSFEIKARRDLNLPAWLRQASLDSRGGVPLLIHRPDGFGPATVRLWPASMRLADLTGLLHAAGYGTPEGTQ